MKRYALTLSVLVVVGAMVPTTSYLQTPQSAAAVQPAARFEPKSSSERAKTLFREALFETQNVGGTRARNPIGEAVKADPTFAIARVYEAFVGPGTGAERAQAITAVMSGMTSAAAPELLMALYWRESAAGRAAAALPILQAVSELVPGDPEIMWMYENAARTGQPASVQPGLVRDYLKKFPGHAAAHNSLAYLLYAAGDSAGALREVQEYVKLAPNHPNSHDSLADILLLMRRPAEALPHVQRELELDPAWVPALEKLGLIALMTGDAVKARADFARGLAIVTVPATKFDFMHWTAATYAYTGDGQSAVRELSSIIAAAETQNLPGQIRTAHERAAVIEAYLGDSKAVSAHLTAAAAGTPPANHYAFKTIASVRIGDLDQARKAAAQFTSMAPTNAVSHTLNALIALQTKDWGTAEKELAQAPSNDLFSKAVRADMLGQQGQTTQATALRQEILTSSVKLDGNPQVDYFKLVAKMYAGKK